MIIKELKVKNYKSLFDVEITNLHSSSIFFGENNAGKSNILSFLEIIFQRKYQILKDGKYENLTTFLSGILKDFKYSYFNNDYSSNISFVVKFQVTPKAIEVDLKDLNNLTGKTYSLEDNLLFQLSGTLKYNELDKQSYFKTNEIKVDEVELYTNDELGNVKYAPSQDEDQTKQSELAAAFSRVIEKFNDCVYLIKDTREVFDEKFSKQQEFELTPHDFKKYLYSLFLSEENYYVFKEINEKFNGGSYEFGNISFANIDGFLEIMIEKGGKRLPLKNLGSGVLQILYILTSIISNKKFIICIEELEQNLSPIKQKETIDGLIKITESDSDTTQLILSSHSPFLYNTAVKSKFSVANVDGKSVITERTVDEVVDGEGVTYAKQHFPGLENFH